MRASLVARQRIVCVGDPITRERVVSVVRSVASHRIAGVVAAVSRKGIMSVGSGVGGVLANQLVRQQPQTSEKTNSRCKRRWKSC
jgi:hypothetical protein